jgi:hypothetical protein
MVMTADEDVSKDARWRDLALLLYSCHSVSGLREASCSTDIGGATLPGSPGGGGSTMEVSDESSGDSVSTTGSVVTKRKMLGTEITLTNLSQMFLSFQA